MAVAPLPRVKDPGKVRGGKAAALVRWGPTPRRIRLDALDDDARRIVLAVVRLAEAAAAAKPASPDTDPD